MDQFIRVFFILIAAGLVFLTCETILFILYGILYTATHF